MTSDASLGDQHHHQTKSIDDSNIRSLDSLGLNTASSTSATSTSRNYMQQHSPIIQRYFPSLLVKGGNNKHTQQRQQQHQGRLQRISLLEREEIGFTTKEEEEEYEADDTSTPSLLASYNNTQVNNEDGELQVNMNNHMQQQQDTNDTPQSNIEEKEKEQEYEVDHHDSQSLMNELYLDQHMWDIDPEELEIGDCIGIGGFGRVHKGTWKGQLVAIKRLNVMLSPKERTQFMKELTIMR